MKAAVNTNYGSPNVVLQLKEVERPTPKGNEVLIKIYATTVNRTDCGFLRAEPFIVRFFSGLTKPKNTILGNEFAGKIEAVGKDVTSFKVGDKVFGYNDVNFGAHAQYMTMPQDGSLANMPSNMTYLEAAPCTEGVHYALNYIRAAHIRKQQKVLINGATGAIGSAAVQLAKLYGAEITAVSNTKNMQLVKSLGAKSIIDYTKEDFTKLDQTFDVILDTVGNVSFGQWKRLLNPGGVYFSSELGKFWQNPWLALLSLVFGSIPGQSCKRVGFPIPKINKEDVVFFKKLIETGKFKLVIDRSYPLEEIVRAYTYVEKGQKTGNVVITVSHTNNT